MKTDEYTDARYYFDEKKSQKEKFEIISFQIWILDKEH